METLRPLGIAEIIDRSVQLWRGAWKDLFRLFVVFQFAEYLILKTWDLVVTHAYPAARSVPRMMEMLKTNKGTVDQEVAMAMGLLVVVFAITLFLSLVGNVAATIYVFPRATGGTPIDVATAFRKTVSKMGPILGMYALTIGWTLVVSIAFVLPGVLLTIGGVVASVESRVLGAALLLIGLVASTLGALAALLWFVLRFIITGQVLAAEQGSAFAAFRRSGVLTSGRVGPGLDGVVKFRLTVLVTIVGVLLLVLGTVTGAPSLILQGVYGNAFDPMRATPENVPQLLLVPAELLATIVGAIFAPLYATMQTLFYIDMRVRREGLDLELRLGATP